MKSRSLGGEGQGFCDGSTLALVIKSVTMRGRMGQNCSKLRDVIYKRPTNVLSKVRRWRVDDKLIRRQMIDSSSCDVCQKF